MHIQHKCKQDRVKRNDAYVETRCPRRIIRSGHIRRRRARCAGEVQSGQFHLIRDRDGPFGPAYTRRIRAIGIRDHPIAPRSPWQNGHVERLIGSIRRESLDHLLVFSEAHLRDVLKNYASYYNKVRRSLVVLSSGRRSLPQIWPCSRRLSSPLIGAQG